MMAQNIFQVLSVNFVHMYYQYLVFAIGWCHGQ